MAFETTFNSVFQFTPMPADVVFGHGVVTRLPEFLSRFETRHPMLVTDPGLKAAAAFEKVNGLLTEAGLKPVLFDGVKADSGSELVMEAAKIAKTDDVDAIIGLGGGSALDSAKAIAAMVTNPGHITDYAGNGKIKVDPLPCIALPTAAGTGSEVSIWSVMTNDDTGSKIGVGSDKLIPEIALCDPDLSLGLPRQMTAAVGMDALGHAVECYTNKACQPISGAIAYQAIQLIGRYLERAVRDGTDRDARYGMMLASTMAGIAMNPTRLGLAHALAMPLGSHDIRIHHGTIIAVTLPAVMRFNHEAAPERFASVAAALGVANGESSLRDAAAAVDAVEQLARKVDIPPTLGTLGLRADHIPLVVEETMGSGNVAVNPRAVTTDDVEAMLQQLL